MARSRLARRLRSDAGFSLIELLIAMMLISVAVMALMSTFDHSRRTTDVSEAQSAATKAGERELERVASLGYSSIAMPVAPTTSLAPNDPNYWVTNSSPAFYRWDQATGGGTEQLAIASGGGVPNDGGTWGNARLGGRVYDYVTWVDDPCGGCTSTTDQGITQDYKRITVAVTANPPSPLTKPVLVSTIVSDPAAKKSP
jgi:prepilin-type N-terminal cleavage/methylation domain-containing protein